MKKILILILSFACLIGHAQEELSLSQAIQLSLQKNYDILIENNRLEVANNKNSWGEAGRWPSVDLNLNQNNGLTDNVKTASPFQLQDITMSNSLSPGVSLNWNLFNGFKVNMSKRRLEELQRESDGNAEIVVSNTIQAVILAYYRVVLEMERLSEFDKQLRLSRDKYNYLKIKTEMGGAGSSELLLEETNYLTDSTNKINQELRLRESSRELNILLAEENPNTRYIMTDPLSTEFEDYDLELLQDKMNSGNIDLKKQYISQSVRSYELEMAKSDKLPSVTFSPGYSHTNSRVDLSNASFPDGEGGFISGPSDPLTAITDNYSANFRLTFTLFNGGKINRSIQNAMIQENISRLSTEKLERSLHKDLANSLDQYTMRKQILTINERKLEVASANLDLASEKFKTGTINSFDFRTVQNNQLTSAIQKLNAQYNLIDSQVALLRLTGGIIDRYGN